jgi:hypothetical protein
MVTPWQRNYISQDSQFDENIKLLLQVDIYCFTFLKFIQVDDPFLHKDLILKSCLTFMIQVSLCVLVLSETKGLGDEIYMGGTTLNAARLLCSLLLHLTIVPEIRISLEMMRYVLNNPKNFYGNGAWFAFFVCGLKNLGAFYAELICIWKMGQ